ncbi:hypothetical protein DFJ43DRAFT_1000579 [Lentinula guzmanii]|uniref:Uncharacterized protein n=1 Tax=Lentinula guzmanii TaxID=2804957 RepID=A0AA38JG77_9AGAR|nr:hypothetical protein DFJ43DRAFT_1000579 [Lentinula guzmanii]
MTSTPRNAEFAHLFDLFEKLASRRSRATDVVEHPVMDDTHTFSIPTDLQPVFRNLATLVTPRTTSAGTRKGRRNTVAVPFGSSDIDTDCESVAQFPIGKQYPFKFKMMLHKLYELEDWGKKVREVLEMSQEKFKPLADTKNSPKSGVKEREDNGTAVAEFGVRPPPKRTGRPRSNTVGPGKEVAPRALGSMARVEPRDDERAVKKRCVGRRKSMSGMAGESSTWVFNATVASSEINQRVDIPAPATVTRYGALQQDGRRRVPPRRRVSSVASVASVIDGRQSIDERSFRKRRATSVAVVKRS